MNELLLGLDDLYLSTQIRTTDAHHVVISAPEDANTGTLLIVIVEQSRH